MEDNSLEVTGHICFLLGVVKWNEDSRMWLRVKEVTGGAGGCEGGLPIGYFFPRFLLVPFQCSFFLD